MVLMIAAMISTIACIITIAKDVSIEIDEFLVPAFNPVRRAVEMQSGDDKEPGI